MSERIIPEHIDPIRFAEQGLKLDGKVNLLDMERLISAKVSAGPDDAVSVSLRFGVDEQGIYFLKGHLQTVLVLECQRCLEPFNYEIIADFVLGLVNTLEQADLLPSQYEPVLTKEGQLALRELIEDELILNLPSIPRHEPEDCSVKLASLDSNEQEPKASNNPFHILESLKDSDKHS